MALITNNKFEIRGRSGKLYDNFSIYTIDHEFENGKGVYAFNRRFKKNNEEFKHDVIYLGRSSDFSGRFDKHHKINCIKNENANCLCVMPVEDENERISIEKDILEANPNFPCNEKND